MSDKPVTGKKPVFDPIKLEQLNVATDYPMDPEEFEVLYRHNCYCEMAHVNSKGFPIVTPMFYVIIDDIIHMSSIQKYRHKVHHLEKDPRISVSIHNDGSNVRHQKAILVIGKAEVSTEEELMKKVHWDIIDKYFFELKTEEERQTAFAAVHTPLRVIVKVNAEKIITWDFGKMLEAHDDGVWFGESNWQQNPHDIRALNLNPPGS